MRLTPPKKHMVLISVLLGAVAIVLYFCAVFGAIGGGFVAIGHYLFWLIVIGWAVLLASVIWEEL